MTARRAQREAWKTFTVAVREVRGHNAIEATVSLSDVAGVDGRPYQPRYLWAGIISHREPGETLSPEEAAELAARALGLAFPGLF